MKVSDLVFYLVGSGEYDELMRAPLLGEITRIHAEMPSVALCDTLLGAALSA